MSQTRPPAGDLTMQWAFTPAASAPANTTVVGSIITDPLVTGVTQYTIPQNEIWVFKDVFISTALTSSQTDGFVELAVNGNTGPPIGLASTLLVSNNSRPRIGILPLPQFSYFTPKQVLAAAAPASPATLNVFVIYNRIQIKR